MSNSSTVGRVSQFRPVSVLRARRRQFDSGTVVSVDIYTGTILVSLIVYIAVGNYAGRRLLRKDFLIDPYQVVEARASGADAVLLIMRILEDGQFADLLKKVREAGMEALVEVHDESDLDRALAQGTRLLGINNRDLSRFKVDLAVTRRLMPRIPSDVVVVSASGIREREQVRSLESEGVKAFLVGEALMTATDPEEKLRELVT